MSEMRVSLLVSMALAAGGCAIGSDNGDVDAMALRLESASGWADASEGEQNPGGTRITVIVDTGVNVPPLDPSIPGVDDGVPADMTDPPSWGLCAFSEFEGYFGPESEAIIFADPTTSRWSVQVTEDIVEGRDKGRPTPRARWSCIRHTDLENAPPPEHFFRGGPVEVADVPDGSHTPTTIPHSGSLCVFSGFRGMLTTWGGSGESDNLVGSFNPSSPAETNPPQELRGALEHPSIGLSNSIAAAATESHSRNGATFSGITTRAFCFRFLLPTGLVPWQLNSAADQVWHDHSRPIPPSVITPLDIPVTAEDNYCFLSGVERSNDAQTNLNRYPMGVRLQTRTPLLPLVPVEIYTFMSEDWWNSSDEVDFGYVECIEKDQGFVAP